MERALPHEWLMEHLTKMNKPAACERLEEESAVGLSSAIHDIRMLSRSYAAHLPLSRSGSESDEPLGGGLQPHILLTPRASTRPNAISLAALALVLGIGSLALAASLAYQRTPEPTRHLVMPEVAPAERARMQRQVATEPSVHGLEEPIVDLAPRRARAPETRLPTSKGQRMSRVEPAAICDEVTCLVDPSGECCQSESLYVAPTIETARPARLSRTEVMAGFRSLNGRLERCFDDSGFTGTAIAEIYVGANGSVLEASIDGADAELAACARPHLEALRFSQSSSPLRVRYPYSFR